VPKSVLLNIQCSVNALALDLGLNDLDLTSHWVSEFGFIIFINVCNENIVICVLKLFRK
jgi:hypothetical protein